MARAMVLLLYYIFIFIFIGGESGLPSSLPGRRNHTKLLQYLPLIAKTQ